MPYPQGAKICSGWWHVMQWAVRESLDVVHLEWSSLIIEMLAMFLVLGSASVTAEKKQSSASRKKRRQASSSLGSMASLSSHGSLGPAGAADDWQTLYLHEAKNSAVCPPWMAGRGWQWALEEVLGDAIHDPDSQAHPGFLTSHIQFAKNFLKSGAGELALGASGYLPTALGCAVDYRRQAAISLFMALHLLLEEQKLDVMMPENGPHGSLHLKVLLCRIARWFVWSDFAEIYSLGIQEELDPRMDGELELSPPITQPSEVPCIFGWIQANLTGRKVPFSTLADIYFNAIGITDKDEPSLDRFVALTPRTFMFRHFFELATPKSTFVEAVEAIHKAGLTPRTLQTLPEAILAPLRDVISKCQARPPTSWSRELLELVNRTDIRLILSPSHRPRHRTTHILVGSLFILARVQSSMLTTI
jgi:anaphase-promoting complex subunit 1